MNGSIEEDRCKMAHGVLVVRSPRTACTFMSSSLLGPYSRKFAATNSDFFKKLPLTLSGKSISWKVLKVGS
ncbi:MAG: hypothetical protein A2Y14_03055 [Verrucomicrobia bacterium GWF2_51_19]|nr:MAG: hypothetical protein A2Y14_03055 [Verrucomicrobia bacterium GWF2_51_19]HCJ11569.1 hypothetical protein [Opitutae bacterium]